MLEYNTARKNLILKEYGRNIQNLVEYIKTIEDKDQRSQSAETLVDLMKQVTPSLRDTPETTQKIWDDLFILAGFELDIDCPYPMPEKSLLGKKPKRLGYQSNEIKYKHYGRNIELLIQEAIKKEDPEEREAAVIYIGKLMKSFYGSWNKDGIDDGVILENIKTISKGELDINLEKVKEDNLFERLYREKKKTSAPTRTGGQRKGGRQGGRSNDNRRRRN